MDIILLENTAGRRGTAGARGGQVVRVRGVVVVLGELLESLALGFLDEQGGENAAEHEKGVDLEDVVEPRVFVRCGRAAGAKRSNSALAWFL